MARPDRPAATRVCAALLAATLALAPVPAATQIDNLPKLGDPSGDELSPQAERRLGESIMRQVRRDPSYLDDADLTDYLNRFAAPLASTQAAGGLALVVFGLRVIFGRRRAA